MCQDLLWGWAWEVTPLASTLINKWGSPWRGATAGTSGNQAGAGGGQMLGRRGGRELPGSTQPAHDLKSIYMLMTLQLTPLSSMLLLDSRLVCTSTCLKPLPGCLQYLTLVTSMTELLTAHRSPHPLPTCPQQDKSAIWLLLIISALKLRKAM